LYNKIFLKCMYKAMNKIAIKVNHNTRLNGEVWFQYLKIFRT